MGFKIAITNVLTTDNKCYNLLSMNQREALEKAIELAGSQEKLAGMTGYTQGAISQMLNREGKASIKAALQFEDALEGKVTRYQLRPDFFGSPPDKNNKQVKKPH